MVFKCSGIYIYPYYFICQDDAGYFCLPVRKLLQNPTKRQFNLNCVIFKHTHC